MKAHILPAAPPDAPKITAVNSYDPTQLTVTWSPASSGSSSTSFNVSISAEGGVNASLMYIYTYIYDGSQEYSHTFTTLIEGTTYTVSVVAINCAGNSRFVYQSRKTAGKSYDGGHNWCIIGNGATAIELNAGLI